MNPGDIEPFKQLCSESNILSYINSSKILRVDSNNHARQRLSLE